MLQVALQLPFSALFYQVANQFITSAMYEPPMMMPTRMNTMSLQSIQSTQVTISSRYLTATANISSLLYCWYVSAQLHQRIVQGYQFPIVSPHAAPIPIRYHPCMASSVIEKLLSHNQSLYIIVITASTDHRLMTYHIG